MAGRPKPRITAPQKTGMEDPTLPLEVDQSSIVPVLLGDKPAIAPPRPPGSKPPPKDDRYPGRKFRPGVIPDEWFAWFEENMDRGVDANELLAILVDKGFQPAKCTRLMQFVAAHESLTVTSTLPVMTHTGEVVAVPTTATIIGSLTTSSTLPPQWTAWIRDNLSMGVDRALLFEILVKHGFEPDKNPVLTQALTQPHQEPSYLTRKDHREKAAKDKEERVRAEKAALEYESKKNRALDFASERGVIVADDLTAQVDTVQKDKELLHESKRQTARKKLPIPTYGFPPTLDVGVEWPANPPMFVHMGPNTVGRDLKAVEAGISTGLKPLRREGPHKLVLPDPTATMLMASQSGVGVDKDGEEGSTFWGAVLRGDLPEVHRYLCAGQHPSEASPVKGIPPVVIATVHRKLEVLKVLVTAGALVNEADRTARTPLHYAAGSGDLDTVTYLVTNGANIFQLDNYGDSAMHVAAARGYPAVLEWLFMYVEERMLRHIMEWQFVEYVKEQFNKLLKERLSEADTQWFQRKWTYEVYLKAYDDAPTLRKLFLPRPVRAAFLLAEERYGGEPALEVYDLAQVTRVVQRACFLTLSMVPNRSGRTPLHMAADPPHHVITEGHVECIRLLVDVFAVDLNAKDNGGRTAMATLIARHRSHRPGIGPHAARKLEIIQSLAERRAELSLEEGVAMESEEGEEEDLDDDGAPVRNPSSARFSPIASQSASFRAGTASALLTSPVGRKAAEVTGTTADAMRYLRIAEARYVEGMRACEWGCRQWIKRGLQERHMEKTCSRRIFPCKFACGVSIRAEQWKMIGERHYASECARRLVPCPLECGGFYADEDIAEHKVKTCVKRAAKPISCPNRCGLRFSGSYDRVRDIEFEVAEHAREACELRLVNCDFNGCYDSMTARERRDHRLRHLRDMGIQVWTTPGKYVYTVPKMVKELMFEVWGGGGGGGQFKHVKGGNGGGGAFVQTVIEVQAGDQFTLVVGSGGSRGIHGVTATPVNEVLKRPEIKQETGKAPGGEPGGGMGFASNSTFAAGGGGGYSAVYAHTPIGLETLVVCGAGGGGGTRDGRPGGLAYVIGQRGEAPDEGVGGCPEEEVSCSSEEEMDLNTWMAKLKERKRMKELGMSGVDPFAPPPTDGMDSSDSTGSPKGRRRDSRGKASGGAGATEISSDSEVSDDDWVPGGRPDIDTRTEKQKIADMKAAATEAAALRKSNVTSDGDDKLRTGRSGGLKAAGKGGYKGGKPGAALKGGDGSEEFGAGGGAGLYGGGGGGTTPGMVGGGGGGSCWVTSKKGYRPIVIPGSGNKPGGAEKFVPEATLAGDWDFMGGPAGLGGIGTKDVMTDGHGGAIRLRLPGYFHITLEKDFRAHVPTVDTGFDGKHGPGVRPDPAEMERVKHTLSVPKSLTFDV